MAEVQSNLHLFDRMGVKVIAASADDEAGARKMAGEQKLTFPVAYGVQPLVAELTGAFSGVRQERTYIQPTEFVINPDGIIAASMYSSTQLGRMNPREILQFLKSRVRAD